MKSQVNFGHLIAVVVGVLIPVLIWGVSVETRFSQVTTNTSTIGVMQEEIKELSKRNNENYIKILEKLQDIELELKDKKDRE